MLFRSPEWMKRRLERSGIRAISALVDVTNYVMLELGQPLHAFDNTRLEGAVHARLAKPEEKLLLLNEQTIAVDADVLVIADDAKPLAMAGIMGGEESGITLDTSELFLESAFFAPKAIAGRARRYGFGSDASHRFERGVDFGGVRRAIERATQLIIDICGGQAGPVVEAKASLPARQPVRLRTARAEKVLGLPLGGERIAGLFRGLALSFEQQGDDFLVAIANRLDTTAHEHNGVAARITGDEFVLFLNNKVKTLDLMRILRQLKLSIIQPLELNKCAVQIGASLGIAVFPDDGVQAEELLLHANQAMRVAKTDGGNAFRFFQPTMTVNMARKMKLEQELRLAIISNQLELFYQPKIRLTTGEITGVEALIRWHHPDEGMLSPAEFIPIAEDSGLIVDLGDWVLVEALRQASIWHKQHIMIDIAINVSVKQLLRRNVSDSICALSEQMAINTHYIQLEITENNMMENLPRIIDQLEQLQNNGFVIAIDDFGTGHSSLASLRDLPVNVLKIDRSFVTQAMEDDKDAQIVRAIIEMGHSLNKQIIAEGIETTEQMYLLQNFNCDEGQGYLFSKPVSARLITPLLEQHMIQISTTTQAPRQHGMNML